MNIIEKNKQRIITLAKSHGVNSIYVFGSAISDSFTSKSDVDILVSFGKVDLYSYFDNYLDLKEKLEKIFNRDVDLVEEQTIKNPILKRTIDRNKQLIWMNA